jgi:hypothetical protein
VALANARYGHPFGVALTHVHQGIALGVYKLVGSTPPLLTLRGSWEELIVDDGWRVEFTSLPTQVHGRLVVCNSKNLV